MFKNFSISPNIFKKVTKLEDVRNHLNFNFLRMMQDKSTLETVFFVPVDNEIRRLHVLFCFCKTQTALANHPEVKNGLTALGILRT
jgi:hypothetical protein